MVLNETWIRTDMTHSLGWCQRGTPLLAKLPDGQWRTLTFIAGLCQSEVVALCVFDGSINGALLTAWVEQSLVPTLKPRPDLNSIELMFAKFEALFRKADRRFVEEAWRKVGSLLAGVRPADAQHTYDMPAMVQ